MNSQCNYFTVFRSNVFRKRCLEFSIAFCTFFFTTQHASSQNYNAVDWGTYFNDNAHFPDFTYQNDDAINQIVVDNNSPESIYITGRTYSAAASTLSFCGGAHTITLKDGGNGFLAKYNRCGELIWSTYIGTLIFSLALDIENGKTIIYVGGKAFGDEAFSCDGSNVPVFQPGGSGNGSNSFIAKYADDDSLPKLLRWTYFGGTSGNGGNDAIYGIAINNHRIFTCGITESSDLYIGGQHISDSTYGGDGDGFVSEFDSLLSTLLFFSYIGGTGNDRCHDIKVSKSITKPAFWVSGSTSSTTSIAKGTGFDHSFGGDNDAFICKWSDKNGSGIFKKKWGTYVGGAANEHGRKSALDSKGNIFLSGFTGSSDFPITPLAYDTTYGVSGGTMNDGFVVKLRTDGSLLWSTYLGGGGNEEVNGIALFKNQGIQYVAIAGVTISTSQTFELMSPIQGLLNGSDAQEYDAFISILTDAGATQQQLIFSSYLGGSNDDRVGVGQYRPSIAFGPHNVLYYGGASKSDDINTVVGSDFQDLVAPYNGGSDGFLAKLIDVNNSNQFNCPVLLPRNQTGTQVENLVNGKISMHPNPTSDFVTVQFSSIEKAYLELNIYNVTNQLMLTKVIEKIEGVNTFHINVSALTQGIYFVEINNGDREERKILIVTKQNTEESVKTAR